MSFIQQYSEGILPPQEPLEITDVEIISERKVVKDKPLEETVEVFSEVPEDTVQESEATPPAASSPKEPPKGGDVVTCLVESEDRTAYVCVEAKVIRVSVLPDRDHGKVVLCILDTGSMIVVGAGMDVALAEMNGAFPGAPRADYISIQSQKYSKKGINKAWVIDKLWKKISTGKRPGGKRH